MNRLPGMMTALAMAAILMAGCSKNAAPPAAPEKAPETRAPDSAAPAEESLPGTADADGWQKAFDGKTLAGWKSTPFGGEGKVEVKDGQIILNTGPGDLTGITWTGGTIPKDHYEIALETCRLDGSDFFCGLTFPVRDSCISLICGGWGGSLVGLSSLDGYDASENETTKMMEFANNRWYRIQVRVSGKKINAWIDDEELVAIDLGERKVSVRWEVEASQPFGVAAWRTKAGLRNIRIRNIEPVPDDTQK